MGMENSVHHSEANENQNVGAGLLAKAVGQPIHLSLTHCHRGQARLPQGSAVFGSKGSGQQVLQGPEVVGFFHRLILPPPQHPGKPHRNPALVAFG